MLVDGLGTNMGRWKIMAVEENQARVIDDGTAMLTRWEIKLTEYPDDATGAQQGG